jgi:hypothetical protein
MHFIRIISTVTIVAVTAFYSSKLLGIVQLQDVMTPDEQQKTGIFQLSEAQKKELENWLNQKFVLKNASLTASSPIYLQQNINNGARLILSDGSIYEIAPTDRTKAAFWITPAELLIKPSNDPLYPSQITNTLTNASVNGKLIQPSQGTKRN